MTDDHVNFPPAIKKQALARQKFHCASCRAMIADVGEGAREDNPFGERAEAHHLIPHKMGGPPTTANCVVLCRSCHYSAHQGGRWRDISIYADMARLPMNAKIAKIAALYPHYNG
jgi:HNH endonuclease